MICLVGRAINPATPSSDGKRAWPSGGDSRSSRSSTAGQRKLWATVCFLGDWSGPLGTRFGSICDIHDVPEACRFPTIGPLGGRGYPWGYRPDLGEGSGGMQRHAVPTSIDLSSTRKSYPLPSVDSKKAIIVDLLPGVHLLDKRRSRCGHSRLAACACSCRISAEIRQPLGYGLVCVEHGRLAEAHAVRHRRRPARSRHSGVIPEAIARGAQGGPRAGPSSLFTAARSRSLLFANKAALAS